MSAAPFGPTDPLDRRIGDAERSQALEALGIHLEAGRIDVTEFSERSAAVSRARTGRDLGLVFADLPAPQPPVPEPPHHPAPAVVPSRDLGPVRPISPPPPAMPARRDSVVVSLVAIVALVLFLLLGRIFPMAWIVFLAVPVIAMALRGRR